MDRATRYIRAPDGGALLPRCVIEQRGARRVFRRGMSVDLGYHDPTPGITPKRFSMLCLSRSAGQTIAVGSDIVIKVLGVVNGVVRLGLEAPSEVKILRGELLRQLAE